MGDLRLYLILVAIALLFPLDSIKALEPTDQILAELEITDLELQDVWDDLEKGRKSSILNQNIREKSSAEEQFGSKMKSEAENLLKHSEDIPNEVLRNWTVITKPGDVLLEAQDWNSLISYCNANDELLNVAKVPCSNGLQGCVFTKAGYRNILDDSRDDKLLRDTWKSWQNLLAPSRDQFPSILGGHKPVCPCGALLKKSKIINIKIHKAGYARIRRSYPRNGFIVAASTAARGVGYFRMILRAAIIGIKKSNVLLPILRGLSMGLVKKAATANGKDDEKSYWETLLDSEGAYENAQKLWDEIEPLYKKLHSFVQSRIFRFYNITSNDTSSIPVYLLGSNFGDDWSNVADIILPHPQLHYDIESKIEQKTSREIYELAEALTSELSLGRLGDKFWENSQFNMSSCENHYFTYVSSDHPYSEVLTCEKTSWVKYLDSFEIAATIALRNLDYQSLPRRNLRYSAIDDAFVSLGATFAINNLPFNGILEPFAFSGDSTINDTKIMSKLLLTALRIFPKLSYYLSADQFRINHFQDGNNEDNLSENWWKIRRKIQGVCGATNEEPDYLGDSNIISNRPYLSKFFGLILQFHIISSYTMNMMDPTGNVATEIGADTNLMTMLLNRPSSSWPDLMSTYFGIYELNASPLLDYFRPLEEYFENAPKEQVKIQTTVKPPTTITTTEKSTSSVNPTIGNSEKPAKNEKSVIQGDQPVVKPVEAVPGRNGNSQTSEIAMYLGIGMLIAVGIILTVLVVRRVKKRLRPARNRRFET